MLVSVIVPVHNTEKYLAECLDSLLGQTLKALEVIAVNNGSKDNSLAILKNYEKAYPGRLIVCDLQVADVSIARNKGIELAKGEYIAFVDSDDYVDTEMYEKMYKRAQENPGGFDSVVCDLIGFYDETDKQFDISSDISSHIYNEAGIRAAFVDSYAVMTNKLFRRTLLDSGVRFTPKVWSEDVEFLYRIFPEIKSMGIVKEPLYYYRQREGSLTHIFNNRLYDYVSNFEAIIQDFKERGYYKTYKNELEYQFVRYVYATMIKRLAKSEDKKIFKEGVKFAKQSVKKNFPNYRKNPLFYSHGLKGFYLILFNRLLAGVIFLKEHKKKI